MEDLTDEELKILNEENKIIVRNMSNALLRHLILHTLLQGKLHGYGLMKVLNEYFQNSISRGLINKIPTSKVYPILNTMEEQGQIISEEGEKNNMRVKFYVITDRGEKLYNIINEDYKKYMQTEIWAEFLEDLK